MASLLALQYWCLNVYLGDQFLMTQRLKYFDMQYQQEGFQNEDPLDFIHHQLQWYHIFIDSTRAGTAKECQSVMENAPPVWGTIVHHSTMADIKEVVNAVNTSQSHLHEAWFQSCKWGNQDRGPRGERHTYKAAWVALDDEDCPSSESLGILDLEGYEDSNREVLFNHQNKPSPLNPKHWDQETQMFPFLPQDQVMSNLKHFAGPCYTCRSEKHWLRDCLKRGDYDKLKEKKLVKGPSKAYNIA